VDNWLEVSLTVEPELVEPVTEVLARFISEGVVIESTSVTAEPDDSNGRTIGPLRVFGYLPMDDKVESKRSMLEEAFWYLGRIRPLPEPEFHIIRNENWVETWKQHYRPVTIGEKLVIIPSWMESHSMNRIPVKIDPGMAFGTGTHPSTQLCLQIFESMVSAGTVTSGTYDVIDIGCGTAILSISALKLGARRALGVDIDEDAIRSAEENAALNNVADQIELRLASFEEIHNGSFSIQKAQVVFANILAPVLVQLLNQGMSDLLTPDGHLVLAGILQEQVMEVQTAAECCGLYLIEQVQQEDWVALRYCRFTYGNSQTVKSL